MNQKILLEQIKIGKMSHAYLLHGEDESNKRKLVDGIAEILKITPPDRHFLEKLPEDKNIKIEAIRELRRSIQLKPHSSQYKLAAIYNGEDLTTEASNAFLKTLEEPPGHSLIFITVRNVRNVLSTVNSRCQKVYVNSEIKIETSKAENIFLSKQVALKDKFKEAEKISKEGDKEIESFIHSAIEQARLKTLVSQEKKEQEKWRKLTDSCLDYFKLLRTNTNKRLLLDNLILDFHYR